MEDEFDDFEFTLMNVSSASDNSPQLTKQSIAESSSPSTKYNTSEYQSLKRKRNAEAARRSRQKKLNRKAELEKRVQVLLEENSSFDAQIRTLETELYCNNEREQELNNIISSLEQQLRESQYAVMQVSGRKKIG